MCDWIELVYVHDLRAISSVDANLSSILHKKSYFLYFTHSFLQNTCISLSILHIYSIKYSFFYLFLLFSLSPLFSHRPNLKASKPKPISLKTTLSLSQTQTTTTKTLRFSLKTTFSLSQSQTTTTQTLRF